MIYRVFVSKKSGFDIEAAGLTADIRASLLVQSLEKLTIVNRYDAENINECDFKKAIPVVFSEPPVDDVFAELPELSENELRFAAEFLPGQFDQRADSAAQCISMLCGCERPLIKYTKIYRLFGGVSEADFARVKNYLINSVEARECSPDGGVSGEKRSGYAAISDITIKQNYDIPDSVAVLTGFISKNKTELSDLRKELSLAMDDDDLLFCRDYFLTEKRDPTITELRLTDTYWSDHCRHTTFGTIIDSAVIEPDYVKSAYLHYKENRTDKAKPICLMDIATSAVKQLKHAGKLPDLDESEEINACSVHIDVDVDGVAEDWLLMFKNETHNHPTEIEPFGGAATCLGGAIRDPLSGRSYVYQAMRVTGASDPLLPVEQTRAGKLPPRKITATAAAGYSSYGNQIGLATGLVDEIYDPGYMAKRMEIGAVIGAAPAENVVRKRPEAGDIVILLGGRTGRDGCGGATGSSKAHDGSSLTKSGAEVQKGNAPEERKLQRLFRNAGASRLIKRCNDFGAGGVAVAVGELADGLVVDLSKVPRKYDGLDGTELAISESQERMAVVVDAKDAAHFCALADSENLEATVIASVTAEPRLKMLWNGATIVDISREFLNSNGAEKHADVSVPSVSVTLSGKSLKSVSDWSEFVSDLAICSRKGLSQRFDSTVGAATVLMPFGGKYQQTPIQAMAAKIPVLSGKTSTASLMSCGYNPVISKQSPFHGAAFAVVESVAKIVATGGNYNNIRLTFQEYFPRVAGTGSDSAGRWGLPFSALLGAYEAQLKLGLPAIGGKDSMSGSFEELDVPPTLVSFAVTTTKSDKIISAEFKAAGNNIVIIKPEYTEDGLPDYRSVLAVLEAVQTQIACGNIVSAWALSAGGAAEAVFKMSLGNHIGADLNVVPDSAVCPGGFVLEAERVFPGATKIGTTTNAYHLALPNGVTINIPDIEPLWENKLDSVFKNTLPALPAPEKITCESRPAMAKPAVISGKPRVLIPVFPGTNGEYDMAGAFRDAGADVDIFVVRNLSASAVSESVAAFAKAVADSQIIALPGGFSAGDEPEGSGKFITSFFFSAPIRDAVSDLLEKRHGLMLGICNGFQALVKLGLLPFGTIREADINSPTLTFNTIGRHISQLVDTRVSSVKSPWLSLTSAGEIYTVPVSHGEGRFVARKTLLDNLIAGGQILSQYVDVDGEPSMDLRYNPNGSMLAIEGLLSPNGHVLGKMGHTERVNLGGEAGHFAKNVPVNGKGSKDMPLFKAGVQYFS